MSNHIKSMTCYLRNHAGSAELYLFENCVKIAIRKKEIVIPFDSIISVIYKRSGFLSKGSMEFKTAQAGYGSINWGFGLSTQLNDANTILFNKDNDNLALEIKTYIENTKNKNAKNMDYSQLEQLKTLLDQGVITQEEFDAKKKQLLGLWEPTKNSNINILGKF